MHLHVYIYAKLHVYFCSFSFLIYICKENDEEIKVYNIDFYLQSSFGQKSRFLSLYLDSHTIYYGAKTQ